MKPQITFSSATLLIFLLAIILVGIILTYFIYDTKQKQSSDELNRHLFLSEEEEAKFTDLTGNDVTFPRSKSDITLVTLWASWSPLSVGDFAVLNSVSEQYNESQLNIILLNRKESLDIAERFLSTQQVPDRSTLVIDANDTYYRNINGYTMPETIMYNKAGETIFHWRGPLVESELRTYLDENL